MTAKTRFCHRFKTHVTELCQISDLEARMLNKKSRLDRFVINFVFYKFFVLLFHLFVVSTELFLCIQFIEFVHEACIIVFECKKVLINIRNIKNALNIL